MKETRAAFALLLFIIAAHVAHLLPQTNANTELTQSYPATICPGPVSAARATALLPNKSVALRNLTKPNAELRRNGQGNYLQTNGAIFVAGSQDSALQIQSRSNKWTAATSCEVGESTAWFVGGTANVTSQSKLILINSGLSDALVDVTAYSENGPATSVPVTVKPSSEKAIRVDSFAPGEDRLVLKVQPRNGRISSYMLDERVRGLSNLGADFVAPIAKPNTSLIIAGLPIKYGNSAKVKHVVRLMNTSQVNTSASIEVISPEGVFIPVGFGNISLKPEEVKDVDLSDLDLGNRTFALKITASETVVAAVKSEARVGAVSDFMWSSASSSFGRVSFNLYGLEPTITFVGEKILVTASWKNNRGRSFEKQLIGDEVLSWKVPTGVRQITLLNESRVVAGMNWLSRDGVTHLNINQGTDIESAEKPIADIGVLKPGR